MDDVEWTCEIPQLVPMEQSVDEPVVSDPQEMAFNEVSSQLDRAEKISLGSRVAITVGSRGIGRLAEIVRGVAEAVKKRGAEPFIIPAMGSHGGDNAQAKATILSHLGVTERSVGARISSTTEIVLAGKGPGGVPVYCQAEAFSADAIFLLNRVKPHTDFRGDLESGLVKMACVGLGGYLAAQWVHRLGYDHLANRIRAAGSAAITMLKIPLGLAIIEGHSGRPTFIKAIPQNKIVFEEKKLLKKARDFVLRLPVKNPDLLVVTKVGKEISGLGLDPLITGRYPSGKVLPDIDIPEIQRVVVLNLTDASEGNASGIGLCDVTTRKLYNKIDFRTTYRNVITSKGAASARVPMVMASDREAICVGLLTCHRKSKDDLRMILIPDTLHLKRFLVSPGLVSACKRAGAREIGAPIELQFDQEGDMMWPDCLKEVMCERSRSS